MAHSSNKSQTAMKAIAANTVITVGLQHLATPSSKHSTTIPTMVMDLVAISTTISHTPTREKISTVFGLDQVLIISWQPTQTEIFLRDL